MRTELEYDSLSEHACWCVKSSRRHVIGQCTFVVHVIWQTCNNFPSGTWLLLLDFLLGDAWWIKNDIQNLLPLLNVQSQGRYRNLTLCHLLQCPWSTTTFKHHACLQQANRCLLPQTYAWDWKRFVFIYAFPTRLWLMWSQWDRPFHLSTRAATCQVQMHHIACISQSETLMMILSASHLISLMM